MALRQIQTGGLVEPYSQTPATDPGQRIAQGITGFAASLLQLARFQQEQKVREAQNERRWKMEIASMRAKQGLQQVQMDHDLLKLKIDQMNLLAKQAEGRAREQEEILTQAVRHAKYLPGRELSDIETELDDVMQSVARTTQRSGGDIMSALLVASPDLKKTLTTLQGKKADQTEEDFKAAVTAVGRQRFHLLQLAQAERQGFLRASPLSMTAAGMVATPIAGLSPTGEIVPAPPPLMGQQIPPVPGTATEANDYIGTIGNLLTPMARRDAEAARAWWGQFMPFFNAHRPPNTQALEAADFDRLPQ